MIQKIREWIRSHGAKGQELTDAERKAYAARKMAFYRDAFAS